MKLRDTCPYIRDVEEKIKLVLHTNSVLVLTC